MGGRSIRAWTPRPVNCAGTGPNSPDCCERIAALKRMRNRMKAESRPHGTGADSGAEESRDEPGRSPRPSGTQGRILIPGFRLIGRIGSGAFGEVWKASSGRKNYAIKFFHGDLHAPDSRGRIMRELEGLTRIMEVGHDLILKIVSLKMKEGTLVLITELADLSLEKLFGGSRHGFPLVQRCAYALGLLQSGRRGPRSSPVPPRPAPPGHQARQPPARPGDMQDRRFRHRLPFPVGPAARR